MFYRKEKIIKKKVRKKSNVDHLLAYLQCLKRHIYLNLSSLKREEVSLYVYEESEEIRGIKKEIKSLRSSIRLLQKGGAKKTKNSTRRRLLQKRAKKTKNSKKKSIKSAKVCPKKVINDDTSIFDVDNSKKGKIDIIKRKIAALKDKLRKMEKTDQETKKDEKRLICKNTPVIRNLEKQIKVIEDIEKLIKPLKSNTLNQLLKNKKFLTQLKKLPIPCRKNNEGENIIDYKQLRVLKIFIESRFVLQYYLFNSQRFTTFNIDEKEQKNIKSKMEKYCGVKINLKVEELKTLFCNLKENFLLLIKLFKTEEKRLEKNEENDNKNIFCVDKGMLSSSFSQALALSVILCDRYMVLHQIEYDLVEFHEAKENFKEFLDLNMDSTILDYYILKEQNNENEKINGVDKNNKEEIFIFRERIKDIFKETMVMFERQFFNESFEEKTKGNLRSISHCGIFARVWLLFEENKKNKFLIERKHNEIEGKFNCDITEKMLFTILPRKLDKRTLESPLKINIDDISIKLLHSFVFFVLKKIEFLKNSLYIDYTHFRYMKKIPFEKKEYKNFLDYCDKKEFINWLLEQPEHLKKLFLVQALKNIYAQSSYYALFFKLCRSAIHRKVLVEIITLKQFKFDVLKSWKDVYTRNLKEVSKHFFPDSDSIEDQNDIENIKKIFLFMLKKGGIKKIDYSKFKFCGLWSRMWRHEYGKKIVFENMKIFEHFFNRRCNFNSSYTKNGDWAISFLIKKFDKDAIKIYLWILENGKNYWQKKISRFVNKGKSAVLNYIKLLEKDLLIDIKSLKNIDGNKQFDDKDEENEGEEEEDNEEKNKSFVEQKSINNKILLIEELLSFLEKVNINGAHDEVDTLKDIKRTLRGLDPEIKEREQFLLNYLDQNDNQDQNDNISANNQIYDATIFGHSDDASRISANDTNDYLFLPKLFFLFNYCDNNREVSAPNMSNKGITKILPDDSFGCLKLKFRLDK